jgi:hypothetical protein
MAIAAGMTVTRVSVTTSATQLRAANSSRQAVLVRPLDGTIYVGDSNAVTTATGFPVKTDEALVLANGEPVFAVAGGTVAVAVLEEA